MLNNLNRRDIQIMGALFIIVVCLRLYFTLTTAHFAPDAYFQVRMVEHITEYSVPMTQDELFAGGRTMLFSPFFHYLLAILAWIVSLSMVLKIMPQLFIAVLPVIVYIIVRTITERYDAALFGGIMASFIPIIYAELLFSVSPLTLAVPLVFFTLFIFVHIERKLYDFQFVLLIAALSLLHPSAVFLIIGLLGYLVVSYLEGIKLENSEMELILFSTFLFLWIQFLIYKRAFLEHGIINFLQQNMPPEIASGVFGLSFANALISIGILPLILGVFCMYSYLFRIKNKYVYLYVSLCFGVGVLVLLQLVQPAIGFIYLGVSLTILSGIAYAQFLDYLKKTKFIPYERMIIGSIYIMLIVSMLIPSLSYARDAQENTVQPPLYDALLWIRSNTPPESVILAPPEEGYLISSIAERKIVADKMFILVPDARKRVQDIDRMYSTQFPIEAVNLFDKYDINYILFSTAALRRYGITTIAYHNQDCIQQVFAEKDVKVYRSRCQLSVV